MEKWQKFTCTHNCGYTHTHSNYDYLFKPKELQNPSIRKCAIRTLISVSFKANHNLAYMISSSENLRGK